MFFHKKLLIILVLIGGLGIAAYLGGMLASPHGPTSLEPTEPPPGLAKATFAGGCFWCTEAVFRQLKGVTDVVPGYCGGMVPRPTYQQVCTGTTGHAEAVQITFDPSVISYEDLLEVLWQAHDPTTLNRQGRDVGTQYRSAIFYHSDEQKRLAERSRAQAEVVGVFSSPIVTEIVPVSDFYRAEVDHQNYYAENPGKGYCQVVIKPKLDKVRSLFRDRLKTAPE